MFGIDTYVKNVGKIFLGKPIADKQQQRDVYNYSRGGAVITGAITVGIVALAIFSAVTIGGFIALSFFALLCWDLTMVQLNVSKVAAPVEKEETFVSTVSNLLNKAKSYTTAMWNGFDTNLIKNTTITKGVFVLYKKIAE